MTYTSDIILEGNWVRGRAVSLHTISSEFVGHDESGKAIFDTKRSEMGELLYQLKYLRDKALISQIINKIHYNFSGLNLDVILPVPPSNITREFQPVTEVARALSIKLSIPILEDFIIKSIDTPELKNVTEYEKRIEILENAFHVKDDYTLSDKNILLFDDLYRSGATLNAITRVLYDKGKVHSVYVLTLTKTRSNE